MQKLYTPKDHLSTVLLTTIPTKVAIQLHRLKAEKIGKGFNLSWKLTSKKAFVSYRDGKTEYLITWDGVKNKTRVKCSAPFVENIATNLSAFVKMEQAIYQQLELMEAELEARSIQAFQTDGAQ